MELDRAIVDIGGLSDERSMITVRGLPAAPTALRAACRSDDQWWHEVDSIEDVTPLDLRRGETTAITIRPQG